MKHSLPHGTQFGMPSFMPIAGMPHGLPSFMPYGIDVGILFFSAIIHAIWQPFGMLFGINFGMFKKSY